MSLEEQLQANTEALEANTDATNALTEIMETLKGGKFTPSGEVGSEPEPVAEETAAQKKKRVAKEKRDAKVAAKTAEEATQTSGDGVNPIIAQAACAAAVKQAASSGGNADTVVTAIRTKIEALGVAHMKRKKCTVDVLNQPALKCLMSWLETTDFSVDQEPATDPGYGF